jgi:glycosyltransferase involved in cell wall biosynthesis
MVNKINLPLVSIALATYNGEKYLSQQLDSLINQTHTNIEIVVVDDCSKDRTVEILKHYQNKFSNIKLLVNEKNLGVNKTFEKAIENCIGEYISLCDQDDIWMLNKIETLVNEVGKEDAYYSNSLLVDEFGNSTGIDFKSIMVMQSYYTGIPFLLSNCVPGHTILVKTNFVKSLLPIPANTFFDLWIGFAAAATNGIKFIDKILVHYRQHSTNVVGTKKSTNKKKKKTANEEFEFKKNELKLLATCPIQNEQTKAINALMIHHFHKRWSFARSAFFFKNFNTILASKNKPYFRKKLYCIKMFFKPNF